MSGRSFILTALICAAIAVAGLLDVRAAQASGDCSWHEAGQEITIHDTVYRCMCARLSGPSGHEIVCNWWAVEKLEGGAVRKLKHRVLAPRLVVAA